MSVHTCGVCRRHRPHARPLRGFPSGCARSRVLNREVGKMSLLPSPSSSRHVPLLGALSLLAVAVLIVGLLVWSRRQLGPPYSPREALRTNNIDKGVHVELFAA